MAKPETGTAVVDQARLKHDTARRYQQAFQRLLKDLKAEAQ
jgi:hypothetical protein